MILIGTPHTHNAGYLRNDDRPGGGKLTQADVQTCPHCQAVILMHEWSSGTESHFCTRCFKPTCGAERCVNECQPYIAYIEKILNHDYRIQQFRKMAGL